MRSFLIHGNMGNSSYEVMEGGMTCAMTSYYNMIVQIDVQMEEFKEIAASTCSKLTSIDCSVPRSTT